MTPYKPEERQNKILSEKKTCITQLSVSVYATSVSLIRQVHRKESHKNLKLEDSYFLRVSCNASMFLRT